METDPVEYQYKCDNTGKTYVWDRMNNTVDSIEKAENDELVVNCSQCGGKHSLISTTAE